jgi:hypothetical protein
VWQKALLRQFDADAAEPNLYMICMRQFSSAAS